MSTFYMIIGALIVGVLVGIILEYFIIRNNPNLCARLLAKARAIKDAVKE